MDNRINLRSIHTLTIIICCGIATIILASWMLLIFHFKIDIHTFALLSVMLASLVFSSIWIILYFKKIPILMKEENDFERWRIKLENDKLVENIRREKEEKQTLRPESEENLNKKQKLDLLKEMWRESEGEERETLMIEILQLVKD